METDSGHNVLISAGQPLLQALIMLAQGGTPPDLTLFRQQMLQGVSRFYRICTARQLHPSLTGKSAFVWCAALDEAVLSTSWGGGIGLAGTHPDRRGVSEPARRRSFFPLSAPGGA